MSDNNLFAAVDIGTTKTFVLIGECARGKLNVLGHGEAPHSGAQRGVLTDTAAASASLGDALHAAERMARVPDQVRRTYFAVSGEHLRGFAHAGVASVAGPAVQPGDLARALADAAVPRCEPGRCLITHLPQGWRVDGRPVAEPLGRKGHRVEADHWRIEGDANEIRRIVAIAAGIGAPVRDFFPAALAAAEIASTPEERRDGVLVADIGASVTDFALFLDGRVRTLGAIPFGGDDLARELATLHKMRPGDAEALKRKVARVHPPAADKNEPLLFTEGQSLIGAHKLTAGGVHGVAEARYRALLERLREAAQSATGADRRVTHCILTGEGASQAGLAELAAAVLGMRCERICDREWKGEPYSDPRHSTAMGVLELAARVELEKRRRLAEEAVAATGRFRRWYRGTALHTLFPL